MRREAGLLLCSHCEAMTGWEVCAIPELKMRFRYPDPTPQQHHVDVKRISRNNGIRVHLTSPGYPELYFEAARYPQATVAQVKADFLQGLRTHAPVPDISEPEGAAISGLKGEVISVRWPDRRRKAYFVKLGSGVNRIILDPASQLNWDIFATLVFDPANG